MLWTGENPEVGAIEENMRSYFNILRGVILLSLSSTVKAGPTLSSGIQISVKQILDTSFTLMKESLSLYGKFLLTSPPAFSQTQKYVILLQFMLCFLISYIYSKYLGILIKIHLEDSSLKKKQIPS